MLWIWICRAYLVDYAVPGKTRVVDNDMDLASAKLRGLLDQIVNVLIAQDVAGHRKRLAALLVDAVGRRLGLLCKAFSSCACLLDTTGNVPASMSEITTFAPSFANNRAASAPMPCAEPVMMAVCPESRPLG